jgi:hypothetical protein
MRQAFWSAIAGGWVVPLLVTSAQKEPAWGSRQCAGGLGRWTGGVRTRVRGKAIEWDKKAAAQGNQESTHFAKWLSEPTNNIGFRNEEEQNVVIAGRFASALSEAIREGCLSGTPPSGLRGWWRRGRNSTAAKGSLKRH